MLQASGKITHTASSICKKRYRPSSAINSVLHTVSNRISTIKWSYINNESTKQSLTKYKHSSNAARPIIICGFQDYARSYHPQNPPPLCLFKNIPYYMDILF